jgi:hypothetical protein
MHTGTYLFEYPVRVHCVVPQIARHRPPRRRYQNATGSNDTMHILRQNVSNNVFVMYVFVCVCVCTCTHMFLQGHFESEQEEMMSVDMSKK